MQVTRTESINKYLHASTHPDLADLYNHDMEVQVNVAQDDGVRIQGDYEGRKWVGWSDGLGNTWKPFRVPYNANTEPTYTDLPMKFDLAQHAIGIGMTGWDWKNKVSKWVAYDFDAIIGHSDKNPNKLGNEELQRVQDAAAEIPWVTIRKSTSGNGLHLYVFIDNIRTENHNEHSALARSILGQMSCLVGFDFDSKVDICGGNMWVWHRKMQGTDGLCIIKQGSVCDEIPPNWRDHIQVVVNKRRRNLPQDTSSPMETLTNQLSHTPLDGEHRKLIDFLRSSDALWWWDQDKHMLVTHTFNLKQAYSDLRMQGFYATNSEGHDLNEQNCFCFPLVNGAWVVRRFSQGCTEHASWGQDNGGWTRCFLNRVPDVGTACKAVTGLENEKGGFEFANAEAAIRAGELLGARIKIGPAIANRATTLKQHKDGRLIVTLPHHPTDMADQMPGWLAKKDKWIRIYNIRASQAVEQEGTGEEKRIRHIITEQSEDYGWVIERDGEFGTEPISHIRIALTAWGYNSKTSSVSLGAGILRPWILVNRPFEPEYPGDRRWNRDGAQFKFIPTEKRPFIYPTWMKIFEHTGKGLDETIRKNDWCKNAGILKGSDYLKLWVASLFQEPMESLPYLFFYSAEQGTGKSTFHEALDLLLTKGYKRADAAMTSQGGFNKELEGSLICVIEETDLNRDKVAYSRMKDWVTSKELLIHAKGETPYHTVNSTHWIQCDNDYKACPIFPGDTRVTMIEVPPLTDEEMIPRKDFIPRLEKEAPDFLADILSMEIPQSNDRLNIPILETADKNIVQQLNMNPLELFILDKCRVSYGDSIKFGDFYDTLKAWLDPNDINKWSKVKVGRNLPPQYPHARLRQSGQFYIGNITWVGKPICTDETHKLVVNDGFLDPGEKK